MNDTDESEDKPALPALTPMQVVLGRIDLDSLPGHLELTETEASNAVDIRPSTLRLWRHQLVGPPFVRHGRLVRYTVSDLKAFRDARKKRVETTTLIPSSRRERLASSAASPSSKEAALAAQLFGTGHLDAAE